jgi:hypothetical protein
LREAHTITKRRIAQAIGAIAILVISCDVSTMLPPGAAFPSPAPGVVETIVAGTAGAAQTQTAILVPATPTLTFTATVTRTATLTPTFTPTFIWRMGSATPQKTATSTLGATVGDLECKLIDQSPADGTEFKPNTDFDAVWEVRNTGTAAWDENGVDFAYVSGRKMHKRATYDLPENVNKGESIALVVDMVAPEENGTYKVVWSLRRGGENFCQVNLAIKVK